MGAVYQARHLRLGNAVAIKIMVADPSNPDGIRRFENEGRAAANIDNEHVVRVYDVEEEQNYAFMVLDLLDGFDLAQLLEREPAKRIPAHVAVNYVVQALKGVVDAHKLGIVHRDLKPSNLFLAKRKDGTTIVKVLDFGISKATSNNPLQEAPGALTSTKAMLGSPLYMSPEQLRNAKTVDHRADIWAMGIILYELITGALPFMGDNLGELFAAILETDPMPLRQRVGDAVPHGLDDVVMRCLQRKPEHRFQTASDLLNALLPFEQAVVGVSTNIGLGSAGATAYIPRGSVQTGPQPQLPTSVGPQTGPQMSALRPATASNANLGPASANIPGAPGAMSAQAHPQLAHTNNSGWQQGMPAGGPKSRTPLYVAVFLAVAAVGVVAGVLALKGKHDPTHDPTLAKDVPPPSALLAEPVVPSATVAANPNPIPSESVAPVVSVAPAVSTAPAVAAPAPVPAPNHHVSRPAPQPVAAPPAPQPAPVSGPKKQELENHR